MRPWNDYEARVRVRAAELGSDGCTGATQTFLLPCLEHDVHYRTHRDLDGQPLTRAEADRRFLQAMQACSWVGAVSPISWIRYVAVRLFGGRAWQKGEDHAVDS